MANRQWQHFFCLNLLIMKNLLFFFLILTVASCSNTVSVADLFEKEGCSGPCYKRMACEGQEVTVRIPLDGSNVLKNGRILFVKDQEDVQKTIKVEFGADVPEDMATQFDDNVGKTAYVKGHIEGYDLLNPTSCKRAHTIYVTKAENITFK